jgi:hypothetical protein
MAAFANGIQVSEGYQDEGATCACEWNSMCDRNTLSCATTTRPLDIQDSCTSAPDAVNAASSGVPEGTRHARAGVTRIGHTQRGAGPYGKESSKRIEDRRADPGGGQQRAGWEA